MSFTFTRVSIDVITFTLSTEATGATGAKIALLPARSSPTGSTTWATVLTYDAPSRTATARLVGPEADPTGATLVIPEYKTDLWALPTGIPDVEPEKITRIYLLGGTGGGPPSSNPYVVSVAGLSGVVTSAALSAALGGTGGGSGNTVVHGADPNVARPVTTSPVVWFGSVDPVNSDDTKDVTVWVAEGDGGPALADGSVTDAKIAANAAIALSKLATDPLARANHTGTQAVSTITGLGSAATQPSSAFDASGAATTAQAAAIAAAATDATTKANAAQAAAQSYAAGAAAGMALVFGA